MKGLYFIFSIITLSMMNCFEVRYELECDNYCIVASSNTIPTSQTQQNSVIQDSINIPQNKDSIKIYVLSSNQHYEITQGKFDFKYFELYANSYFSNLWLLNNADTGLTFSGTSINLECTSLSFCECSLNFKKMINI